MRAMDQVGNVLGRYPDVATAVLVGSHTDTVPKGGWLDGALGVIYGLEIARSAIEAGSISRPASTWSRLKTRRGRSCRSSAADRSATM